MSSPRLRFLFYIYIYMWVWIYYVSCFPCVHVFVYKCIYCAIVVCWIFVYPIFSNGCIRLSVSTINCTYELLGTTHVTPFRSYRNHSTGPSTYGPRVHTYSKLISCNPTLRFVVIKAQSNKIYTYGMVSHGSFPRIRRYGSFNLRTVEYDHLFGPLV